MSRFTSHFPTGLSSSNGFSGLLMGEDSSNDLSLRAMLGLLAVLGKALTRKEAGVNIPVPAGEGVSATVLSRGEFEPFL